MICERFLGSVWRACLDNILLFSEERMRHVVMAYIDYCIPVHRNQGIDQRISESMMHGTRSALASGLIHRYPILGGFHHIFCYAV